MQLKVYIFKYDNYYGNNLFKNDMFISGDLANDAYMADFKQLINN